MLLSSNHIDLQILTGVEINIDYVRSEGKKTAKSGGQYIRLKEAYFFFGNLFLCLSHHYAITVKCKRMKKSYRDICAVKENNKLILTYIKQMTICLHIPKKNTLRALSSTYIDMTNMTSLLKS